MSQGGTALSLSLTHSYTHIHTHIVETNFKKKFSFWKTKMLFLHSQLPLGESLVNFTIDNLPALLLERQKAGMLCLSATPQLWELERHCLSPGARAEVEKQSAQVLCCVLRKVTSNCTTLGEIVYSTKLAFSDKIGEGIKKFPTSSA